MLYNDFNIICVLNFLYNLCSCVCETWDPTVVIGQMAMYVKNVLSDDD